MPSLQVLLRRRFSVSQTLVSPRGSATLSQKVQRFATGSAWSAEIKKKKLVYQYSMVFRYSARFFRQGHRA